MHLGCLIWVWQLLRWGGVSEAVWSPLKCVHDLTHIGKFSMYPIDFVCLKPCSIFHGCLCLPKVCVIHCKVENVICGDTTLIPWNFQRLSYTSGILWYHYFRVIPWNRPIVSWSVPESLKMICVKWYGTVLLSTESAPLCFELEICLVGIWSPQLNLGLQNKLYFL